MAGYDEIPLDVPDIPGGAISTALPDVTIPDTGGFNFGDFAKSIGTGLSDFGGIAKGLLPFAQLGLGGLNIYEGIQGGQQLGKQTKIAENAAKMRQQLAGQASSAAAPVQAFSQEQLDLAKAGKIDPAMQQQIDLWANGAKQQAKDYAARAGIGSSSTLTSWLSWIDQQAEAMKAKTLQSMQQMGVQAGGVAGGILSGASASAGGAGDIAINQQQSLESLIGAANKTLAQLTASTG